MNFLPEQEIYVLIPAAGTGSRMGSRKNKQFLKIKGVPTIIRTALIFDQMEKINGFRVIVSREDLNSMEELFDKYNFKKFIGFSTGGETRQHSVLNGLKDLSVFQKPSKEALVLIHDGARCLVNTEIINRCLAAIIKFKGTCGAAVPVKDTIKSAKDFMVDTTLDRSCLWAMQTPQGGVYSELFSAYLEITEKNQLVTDDLAVMEAAGYKTWLSYGDYKNIKITTPEDLILAEAFIAYSKESF